MVSRPRATVAMLAAERGMAAFISRGVASGVTDSMLMFSRRGWLMGRAAVVGEIEPEVVAGVRTLRAEGHAHLRIVVAGEVDVREFDGRVRIEAGGAGQNERMEPGASAGVARRCAAACGVGPCVFRRLLEALEGQNGAARAFGIQAPRDRHGIGGRCAGGVGGKEHDDVVAEGQRNGGNRPLDGGWDCAHGAGQFVRPLEPAAGEHVACAGKRDVGDRVGNGEGIRLRIGDEHLGIVHGGGLCLEREGQRPAAGG